MNIKESEDKKMKEYETFNCITDLSNKQLREIANKYGSNIVNELKDVLNDPEGLMLFKKLGLEEPPKDVCTQDDNIYTWDDDDEIPPY